MEEQQQLPVQAGDDDWPIEEYTEAEELGDTGDIPGEVIDDVEIETLEELRRQGTPGGSDDEHPYFALPPDRTLLKNWMEWRQQVNDKLSSVISKTDGTGGRTNMALTASKDKKTPEFLQGVLAPEGLRLKDEFAMKPEDEHRKAESHTEDSIIDENFLMFGIPRIRSSSINKRPVDTASNSSYSEDKRATICNEHVSPKLGDASRKYGVATPTDNYGYAANDINDKHKAIHPSTIPSITINKSFNNDGYINCNTTNHTLKYKRGENLAQRKMPVHVGLDPPFAMSQTMSSSPSMTRKFKEKDIVKEIMLSGRYGNSVKERRYMDSIEPCGRERSNSWHVRTSGTEVTRGDHNTKQVTADVTSRKQKIKSNESSKPLSRSPLTRNKNETGDTGKCSKLTEGADFCMF